MYTALIIQEDDMYVATCVEHNIASQGYTIEEAMDNLKEAVGLYLEEIAEDTHAVVSTSNIFLTSFSPIYSSGYAGITSR